jgi:hypothetical protein
LYNVNNVKIALKWTKLPDIRLCSKRRFKSSIILKTMLCVSFSTGTFTISHHFSQFKHLSYNMTSYYDCFITWNRKTSTLDILARHPKTDVTLLCVGPKLWIFGILYTILSTFNWLNIRIECFLVLSLLSV